MNTQYIVCHKNEIPRADFGQEKGITCWTSINNSGTLASCTMHENDTLSISAWMQYSQLLEDKFFLVVNVYAQYDYNPESKIH
jgi:hypothetical protein